ncbi:copper chaperone PCu(A)C [Brevundimonas subvibrioides]|nr:copper chaperone PCu(A)C [Brevundimonas subvibrioides]
MTRLLLSACLLTLAACGQASAPAGPATVAVSDALCRPTPNGRDVTGCYLTLTASQADRLISVGSPVSGLAQIHEMKTENGMMMMGELKDGLALPAGEAVSLAPGGNHIMLLQLKQPLAAGEQVPLTLTFEHAQPVGVRAAVGQPPAAS